MDSEKLIISYLTF